MKNSNAWLRQETFKEAADRCLAEEGATLDAITPYRVAQALGCNANATVYKHHRAWKAEKMTEAGARSYALPAEMLEPLEQVLDRLKVEFMSATTTAVGAVIHALDEGANVKIAEAIRARSESEASLKALLDEWEKDARALDEANQRIVDLEADLAECRTEMHRLEGRLQQIMAERERGSRAAEGSRQ